MNISPTTPHTQYQPTPSENQAARNIQRLFRGYMVRAQETCNICLEDDRLVNLQTICPRTANRAGGHRFHLTCAQDAFAHVRQPTNPNIMRQAPCPTCRTNLFSVAEAQNALSRLGSSAASYAPPPLTVAQARQRYAAALENMRENPNSIPLLEEAAIAYTLLTMLQNNEASIA